MIIKLPSDNNTNNNNDIIGDKNIIYNNEAIINGKILCNFTMNRFKITW